MAYRPQFAYPPAPAGFRDEPFEYFFDEQTVPALNITLEAGELVGDIVLTTEPDSEFHARGIQIGDATHCVPLGVKIRDGLGNYLSDDYVPMQFFCGFLPGADFAGGESCALEPELVVPPGGNFTISIRNLVPDPPMVIGPPVLIAGPGGGTLGSFSGVVWGSVTRGNGEVWQFVSQPTPNEDTMGGYLLNAAGTFDLEGGTSAGVSSLNSAMYWDGVSNLVTFAGQTGLQDFDLDARAWGPVYATNNYNGFGATALWRLSTGWIQVLNPHGDYSKYTAQIYSNGGAAWGSSFEIDLNVTNPSPEPVTCSFDNLTSVLDPATDILHCIFHADSVTENFYYQAVLPDGTLGAFSVLANSSFNFYQTTITPSTMQIVGDLLLWGVALNGTDVNVGTYQYPALLIGTGLSGPSWAATASIDPNEFTDITAGPPYPLPQPPTTYPNLFYKQGVLYGAYIRSVYTTGTYPLNEGAIQISQTTTPGFVTGWTSFEYYDPNLTPSLFPHGHTALGFTPLMSFEPGGAWNGMSVDYTDTTGPDVEQRYWVGNASGISIAPFPITFRGVKRFNAQGCQQ